MFWAILLYVNDLDQPNSLEIAIFSLTTHFVPFSRAIAVFLSVSLLVVGTAKADVVVKDHSTDLSLWTGTGLLRCFEDTSNTADSYAASAFMGNGAVIKQVEGIFWIADGSFLADAGDWGQMDFRFVFYADSAAFAADARVGTSSITLPEPDNVDWLTPVGIAFDVGSMQTFSLYRFEFDVESLGVMTQAGTEHLAAIVPEGALFTAGQTGVVYSTGDVGAIGAELDWYTNFFPLSPDTLQNHAAEENYFAFRIVLGDPPCPADTDDDGMVGIEDFLAILGNWGPCPAPCGADTDDSGDVGIDDFLAVLGNWGPCP